MRNLSPERDIFSHMRTLLVGLSIFALAGTALMTAQEPAAPASNGDQGVVLPPVIVRNVQAPVTVLDRDGRVVNGLNATDFTLYDNNRPQMIFEDLASHPISLVVVIQASANMEKILPQIRKAGSLFDNLVVGQDGEMAVIAFDHRIRVLTNFTSDPDQIHAAFSRDKLTPGSLTSALNDGAMAGINMLKTRPENRKRIMILISESRDGGSGMHVRDVLTEAEFANVVVYPMDVSHLLTSLTGTQPPPPSSMNRIPPGGIALPGGNVNTPTTDLQMYNNGDWTPVFKEIFVAVKGIFVPNPLEVYSRFTGGREFPFFSQKGLEQAIDDIGQDLHNQYILTYEPTTKNEAGYHTIRVEVDKPGLKVFTREGYWMAAKPQ